MRIIDWEPRLIASIKRHDAPFVWGSNDCFRLAMDAVCAVTGRRMGLNFEYTDKRKALTLLKENGDVMGVMDTVLERTDRPLRGDVVADVSDGHYCLGVCLGGVSAFISRIGIEYRKLSDYALAWRVA